jgi:L-lactate dehydrogenase (cytochrome)
MARLSHPEGEKVFARGAGEAGIIQFISTNASASIEEILSGAISPEQPFFFQVRLSLPFSPPYSFCSASADSINIHPSPQLYVSKVRGDTEQLLQRVQATGQVKAIFATVDTAARGKRERDERDQAAIEVVRSQKPLIFWSASDASPLSSSPSRVRA